MDQMQKETFKNIIWRKQGRSREFGKWLFEKGFYLINKIAVAEPNYKFVSVNVPFGFKGRDAYTGTAAYWQACL